MVRFIVFALCFQITLQKGWFCLYLLQKSLFPHTLATKLGNFHPFKHCQSDRGEWLSHACLHLYFFDYGWSWTCFPITSYTFAIKFWSWTQELTCIPVKFYLAGFHQSFLPAEIIWILVLWFQHTGLPTQPCVICMVDKQLSLASSKLLIEC